MWDRTLGALHVGALLISASYGIGFLFGSGEYAVRHGMAGAIYGVATAAGMIAMATFAGRLWQTGRAVWDLLGDRCGERMRTLVALLSVVWMAGVLAAQIHGAVASLRLLGVGTVSAYAVAAGLVVGASRFDLRHASLLFAACLALSAAVMLYALISAGGVGLFTHSLPAFARALPSLGLAQSLTVAVGVSLLVCTGSDYHQFVLAARDRKAATGGCLLAGCGLIILAFLPPAVVLSAIAHPSWPGVSDSRQVVPQVLFIAAQRLSPAAGPLMLGSLVVAALGSGAAVLRAMVSALQAAQVSLGRGHGSTGALTAVALIAALGLTLSGMSIVDTMVSVNVVYIASVGVSLAALLRGAEKHGLDETLVVAAGFTGAAFVAIGGSLGRGIANVELVALLAGLGCAALTRFALHRRSSSVA